MVHLPARKVVHTPFPRQKILTRPAMVITIPHEGPHESFMDSYEGPAPRRLSRLMEAHYDSMSKRRRIIWVSGEESSHPRRASHSK